MGQEAAIREGYGGAQAINSQALASLPQQFEPAKKALGVAKTNAIQYAQDRGQQDMAATQQSLVSRGLNNSTVLDNARLGVGSDVSRRVSDIENLYAQHFGQLDLAQGQQRQRLLGNKAQLSMGLGQSLAGQRNYHQSLQQQWELSQDPNAWLDSVLGIAGTAAGAYIGKNL
jgi:hypothetical protein